MRSWDHSRDRTTGQAIAVVSVPASAIREASGHEVLSVRHLARA